MLTKQAREKIAERAKICDCLHFSGLYECLLGHSVPADTSNKEDYKVFLARLIDLCDTSNMIELPRDKDGVPIHIGDTVWYDGEVYKVSSIRYDDIGLFGIEIYIRRNTERFRAFWRKPSEITHADPISEYERIAQEIEEIAAGSSGTVIADDLRLVAKEIRELSDSND